MIIWLGWRMAGMGTPDLRARHPCAYTRTRPHHCAVGKHRHQAQTKGLEAPRHTSPLNMHPGAPGTFGESTMPLREPAEDYMTTTTPVDRLTRDQRSQIAVSTPTRIAMTITPTASGSHER